MLRSKVCHIFRTGRPTNFKLGIEMDHEDQYHRQAPVVKSQVARLHLTGVSRERKVPEIPKFVRRLTTLWATVALQV